MKVIRKHFSTEQRLLHHMMLHSKDYPNQGLLYGRLGVALVMEQYAMNTQLKPVRILAENIIEESFEHISCDVPLDLASGLCGIGWSIEYMLQNGYVKGNSLDICEAIDKKLMQENPIFPEDLSLERGLEGKLHYILSHIQGTKDIGNPFSTQYLELLMTKLNLIIESNRTTTSTMRNLIILFTKMYHSKPWSYSLDLANFVSSDVKNSKEVLGLRKGLAGFFLTNYMS